MASRQVDSYVDTDMLVGTYLDLSMVETWSFWKVSYWMDLGWRSPGWIMESGSGVACLWEDVSAAAAWAVKFDADWLAQRRRSSCCRRSLTATCIPGSQEKICAPTRGAQYRPLKGNHSRTATTFAWSSTCFCGCRHRLP